MVWKDYAVTEKEHEDEFARWLTDNGHDSERLSMDGCRGYPDRTVWLSTGQTVYVEMKKCGGRLSLHQKRWRARLEKTNQKWYECWSSDEAIEYMEELLNGV
jgi:hypothetical protein